MTSHFYRLGGTGSQTGSGSSLQRTLSEAGSCACSDSTTLNCAAASRSIVRPSGRPSTRTGNCQGSIVTPVARSVPVLVSVNRDSDRVSLNATGGGVTRSTCRSAAAADRSEALAARSAASFALLALRRESCHVITDSASARNATTNPALSMAQECAA